MSRVGQISIASPGEPLQLFFNESELKDVIENQAQAGDHVTMYPGNYTTLGQSQEILIPEGVNLTILPGAKVQYAPAFRTNGDFSHDGDPFDSQNGGTRNHPLSDGTIDRYEIPNFKGFIENIVDMNFGSEWAFESDLEDLRNVVNGLNTSQFFDVTTDSTNTTVRANLGETIEFRSGSNIDIGFDRLNGGDGVFIEWNFTPTVGVDRVFAGEKLESANGNVTGEVTFDHKTTNTLFTPNNDDIATINEVPNEKVEVVDSISTDVFGHVDGVRVRQIVEVVDSVPQDFEGQDGDIRLVVIN